MFLEQLPQQLVNSIILGSIYALLALGYTMTYGIIKLINFAHGDICILGAFIGCYAISNLHMNFWTALIFTMIAAARLGVVIGFLAYRPLHRSTRIIALITAISVSFFLEYGMIFLAGANTRSFPQAIGIVSYKVSSVTVTNIQLLILIVPPVLIIALQLVVKKIRMGKAMRAVSVDSSTAELIGTSINSTISFTLALGSTLVGAADMLIGLYCNSVGPSMGVMPGIRTFVAAVLGGIDIIPGAALGRFAVGILETLSTPLNLSSYRDAIAYGVLIIILLIRPAGTLGKNAKEKM